MLFKLSIKNIKKSFKDYAIYFLTLVLGVAIFYMFNSLDSQQAMLDVSKATSDIIDLMMSLLSFVSVFVAVVLGLLIVYANNFLINRRKKEFGIYMTLGMGKRQISKIILLETLLIGIISLIAGLIIGIFASQFMSILVAKMFEADMTNFTFIFSKSSCIKTCIYYGIMYFLVIFFNTYTISRYRLINLLNATKKNEEIKLKNPILSVLIFIVACIILGIAYWLVTRGVAKLDTATKVIIPIIMGIVGTILVFWSLSGFILKLVQINKNVYFKGTNMFVLRQLNNKINTTVISISVICLMLFMTISILSSSLSLKASMAKELEKVTPVDLNLNKSAYLTESYVSKFTGKTVTMSENQIKDSRISIVETLKNCDFDMSMLKDIIEIPIYTDKNLTWGEFFEGKMDYLSLNYDTCEDIIKISDYNKVADLYNIPKYELSDDEFIVLCTFENMKATRNMIMSKDKKLQIAGKEYRSKYDECQDGFVHISNSHSNMGIILVPDSCNLSEENQETWFLAANYNVKSDKEKEKIEDIFSNDESSLFQNIKKQESTLKSLSKISLLESSIGLSAIIVFIAIYLGIIFLIASVAILALKQLTESSDNRQRYIILRKIGCDEKMINEALFKQIGIFFLMPLILAIIHSIFGIKFICMIFDTFTSSSDLLPSIIGTAIIIGIIYALYFLATYSGSKNIIRDEE